MDIKTRCKVDNFKTKHTELLVQGQAFCILHPDQKTKEKLSTANKGKQLLNGDRISIDRMFEKCEGKKLIQHTEALSKPMSCIASLPQLTTGRHSFITSCSDSASLTNSLTTSCAGSIPTEHRIRTKDANVRVEEMKQSTHPSSTMIKSIESSADLTSETDPATDNIPLKQLPPFPIEAATPKKITKS